MLGYNSSEVIGHYTPHMFFSPGELSEHVRELSRQFGSGIDNTNVLFVKARAGFVDEGKFTLLRKSGRSFEAQVSIGALRNENADVYAFLMVLRE
jgi:hypothetical protein